MAKVCDLSFQQKSLFQQGYQRFTPAELKQLEWGLRFTPLACSLITAYALYYQIPALLLIVAGLGIWAFFFPAKHPMDLLYNNGVRHLFKAAKLPENPFQRRLACLAAGAMNIIAAGLFYLQMPTAALIVGGLLLVLQAIVIFTHFCTLSWMYEGIMRLFNRWHTPIDIKDATSLLQKGALLIDVRSPNEYSKETITGAINVPLEELHHHLDTIKDAVCLVFCNSGTRSHIATEKLKGHGHTHVFNLGAFNRAAQLSPPNNPA